MTHLDLVVVGGGIAGLAAAWEARQQGASVVVLEAEAAVGGKIRSSPIAGMVLDEAADAFLTRVPDAVELCRELGLEEELVAPASPSRAYVYARGELRPLPEQQLLGVPTDLDAVAASGLLSAAGLARARADLTRPGDRPGARPAGSGQRARAAGSGRRGDESVGDLVRRRLGDEVFATLVAPLVGGIWAADCDRLSLATATPGLLDARDRDPSLIRAATEIRAAAAAGDRTGPVFLAPRGGMAQLVDTLRDALGDAIRPDAPATGLVRRGTTWTIEPQGLTADAVVVATPAPTAAALLLPHSPGAAATIGQVDYASVVLVTLAVPREGIERELDGSGFLVAQTEGLLLTACSWMSSKWPHLAGDGSTVLLRASAGRAGDERALQLDDADLVAALHADLAATMGLVADPDEVRVSRWRHAFPQPTPGHLDRLAALEDQLAQDAPGVALAGAWTRGVGVPACIRSGRRGAATVLNARASSPG